MEDTLLEYIPVIGDIYRYGKLGYKIGGWLSNNSATDELLSRMASVIQSACNAGTIDESYQYLSNFNNLINQYNGGLKYQNALFIFLTAKATHLLALCEWANNASDLEGLKKVDKIFKFANTVCSNISEINMTLLTTNRDMIKEIRSLVAEEKKNIRDSEMKWRKHCSKLYRIEHPWKFWLGRVSIPVVIISVSIISYLFVYFLSIS
ncbi:MAG: hypothetical protein NC548_39915 [Lachnospiraceae bacterium]|nr:hypothetical protein [Lachnospiraceae bacterium]